MQGQQLTLQKPTKKSKSRSSAQRSLSNNNSETVLVMAKNLDDLNEVISSLEHRSIMMNNH